MSDSGSVIPGPNRYPGAVGAAECRNTRRSTTGWVVMRLARWKEAGRHNRSYNRKLGLAPGRIGQDEMTGARVEDLARWTSFESGRGLGVVAASVQPLRAAAGQAAAGRAGGFVFCLSSG